LASLAGNRNGGGSTPRGKTGRKEKMQMHRMPARVKGWIAGTQFTAPGAGTFLNSDWRSRSPADENPFRK
jgi:hypothetical protein